MVATYVPGPHGPMVFASTGGAGATTTFDPAHKSTHITLSGGNLISTSGAGSGNSTAVRSIASHSTGKFYAEFTLTTTSVSGTDAVGLVNSSFVIDGGSFLGSTANGLAMYSDGSGFGFTQSSVIGAFTAGDVIGIAVDIGAGLIWFRKNAGAWNGAGGDPTSGTSNASFTVAGALFAAVEAETSGDVWTANFGGSAYAQSVPPGYGNW